MKRGAVRAAVWLRSTDWLMLCAMFLIGVLAAPAGWVRLAGVIVLMTFALTRAEKHAHRGRHGPMVDDERTPH